MGALHNQLYKDLKKNIDPNDYEKLIQRLIEAHNEWLVIQKKSADIKRADWAEAAGICADFCAEKLHEITKLQIEKMGKQELIKQMEKETQDFIKQAEKEEGGMPTPEELERQEKISMPKSNERKQTAAYTAIPHNATKEIREVSKAFVHNAIHKIKAHRNKHIMLDANAIDQLQASSNKIVEKLLPYKNDKEIQRNLELHKKLTIVLTREIMQESNIFLRDAIQKLKAIHNKNMPSRLDAETLDQLQVTSKNLIETLSKYKDNQAIQNHLTVHEKLAVALAGEKNIVETKKIPGAMTQKEMAAAEGETEIVKNRREEKALPKQTSKVKRSGTVYESMSDKPSNITGALHGIHENFIGQHEGSKKQMEPSVQNLERPKQKR